MRATSNSQSRKREGCSIQKPSPRPDHQRPEIRQVAIQRYHEDTLALYNAATRSRRMPDPRDVRVLKSIARALVAAYESVRSFIVAHALGLVDPQTREIRCARCRGCSRAADRGDGVIVCRERQSRCGCPAWLLAGVWWRTWLWSSECPLGYWGPGRFLRSPEIADQDKDESSEPMTRSATHSRHQNTV
jgi:hypothetical protein